jgi:DNA polymerase/3'-5' exonuclease PolX
MKWQQAYDIAFKVLKELEPHCYKVHIAGSIRRMKSEVNDIKIVCIPKDYNPSGLFATGIAKVCQQWPKIKGEFDSKKTLKNTQRSLPEGIVLDLFIANHNNWGYILAIRTGPWQYSKDVLAAGWVRRGYKGIDGYLTMRGNRIDVPEEKDLFKRIGIPYVMPENRRENNQ